MLTLITMTLWTININQEPQTVNADDTTINLKQKRLHINPTNQTYNYDSMTIYPTQKRIDITIPIFRSGFEL